MARDIAGKTVAVSGAVAVTIRLSKAEQLGAKVVTCSTDSTIWL